MLILLQLDCTLFQNLLTLAKMEFKVYFKAYIIYLISYKLYDTLYISYMIYGMTDTVQQL